MLFKLLNIHTIMFVVIFPFSLPLYADSDVDKLKQPMRIAGIMFPEGTIVQCWDLQYSFVTIPNDMTIYHIEFPASTKLLADNINGHLHSVCKTLIEPTTIYDVEFPALTDVCYTIEHRERHVYDDSFYQIGEPLV